MTNRLILLFLKNLTLDYLSSRNQLLYFKFIIYKIKREVFFKSLKLSSNSELHFQITTIKYCTIIILRYVICDDIWRGVKSSKTIIILCF